MIKNKVALIGNFPPRRCGIATFTNDLYNGLTENLAETEVIAMNDGFEKYNYSNAVTFEIQQNDVAAYINAAHYINTNGFHSVILQHEFGIFGGKDGKHILQLLKRLRIPVIITLHTILDNPSEGQRKVIHELARYAHKIISMSEMGMQILQDIYDIPLSKIAHIHHGIHELNLKNENLKKKLGVENKQVLLTFGLLSKNKSIEVVIEALPEVVKHHKNLVYIVLGATHPHVVKHDGEAYRHSLIKRVNELGIEKHVIFVNRFISNKELFEYLSACDIYVIPYACEKQITSGTLIYAMGAHNAIVSTPFWYANEMLSENRGMLFPFGDSVQLSGIIKDLLDNPDKMKVLSENAFSFAKNCYWPNIGNQYVHLMRKTVEETDKVITDGYGIAENRETLLTPTPLKLTQLSLLTDDTGMLQHARYNIPDRRHGYCIDDNARALMLSVMLQNDVEDTDELNRLSGTYLSFMDYAYNPQNGRFRNFMTYTRQWIEEEGSEDSQGRTIWSLGYTAAHASNGNFFQHANYLFDKAVNIVPHLNYPRSIAYAILGLIHYLKVIDNDERFSVLEKKASQLSAFFDNAIQNKSWPWYEKIVTYANARIPQALIASGKFLGNETLFKRGVQLLDWLIEKQFVNDVFSPIGNQGWLTPEGKAQFDQQPIEAHGMIDACLEAEEYFLNEKYGDIALKTFAWYLGTNDVKQPLYDFSTGGCRDGLYARGVNQNQGAESTLSWLMSLLNISLYLRTKKVNEYAGSEKISY